MEAVDREQLEAQKLQLEIQALRKPFYWNHTFWLSFATAVAASIGVVGQSYVSKYENARAEFLRDKAKKDLDSLNIRTVFARAVLDSAQGKIVELTKTKQNLSQQITTLLESVSETEAARSSVKIQSAVKLANNSLYSIALYGYKIEPAELAKSSTYLAAGGYTVTGATLLPSRPPWLSASSVVLYYDTRTAAVAQAIATALSAQLGLPVAFTKGAGLGIPKGEERRELRIHLVGR
ncbi:hypothetical protein GO988_14130 [Hymenobacter sp. HMF4947]|uniref:Uncharacterized protein n=1 Tax=Hymenobacter ginkgonis TaxID=2682976 RepID=A0A7K1TGF2_9BACT|nr:hypothetical protein [Hymenobacter ginkgonis]MVN77470.1 hypothetical protein [Hymenobacter ginkgonis]